MHSVLDGIAERPIEAQREPTSKCEPAPPYTHEHKGHVLPRHMTPGFSPDIGSKYIVQLHVVELRATKLLNDLETNAFWKTPYLTRHVSSIEEKIERTH